MPLTDKDIKRASKIAVKNMKKVLPTLSGSRLNELRALCAATFTPNLSGEEKGDFLKRTKGEK